MIKIMQMIFISVKDNLKFILIDFKWHRNSKMTAIYRNLHSKCIEIIQFAFMCTNCTFAQPQEYEQICTGCKLLKHRSHGQNTPGANLHQNCAHEHGFRFTGWWVRGQFPPVIHNWRSFLQFLDIALLLIFSRRG